MSFKIGIRPSVMAAKNISSGVGMMVRSSTLAWASLHMILNDLESPAAQACRIGSLQFRTRVLLLEGRCVPITNACWCKRKKYAYRAIGGISYLLHHRPLGPRYVVARYPGGLS